MCRVRPKSYSLFRLSFDCLCTTKGRWCFSSHSSEQVFEGLYARVFPLIQCKPGFEYHVEAKWGVAKPSQTEKADTDDEDEEVLAKGSVEFPDLADDAGGDYEWEIKTETTGSVAEECKNLIKSNKKAFEDLIQKWVEDMKR